MRKKNRPILVTGIPRSGTTWVGRTISEVPFVRYLHEPFNISTRTCACGVRFDKWFYYVSADNESRFRRHLEHLIKNPTGRFGFLNMVLAMRETKNLRPLKLYATGIRAKRTVMKDPLAALSSIWLSSTFDMNVVVVVRHPAAVVSSYKRLNWNHPFSHFLDQPLLISDYLYPFADELEDFARRTRDIVDQAAFLWKLVYYVLSQQHHVCDDWILVRHEDLCGEVATEFRNLFQKLDLPVTGSVSRAIQETSEPSSSLDSADPYSIARNSKALIGRWKSFLSDGEIERIRARVGEVASTFYSDDDW